MTVTRDDPSLQRTLGLPASLAIGIGTMVGAGLFVFPGVAGGEAGPAAIVSFAIGGVLALLVAACTAELAVQMPLDGGGYHFVSRTFGALAGTLVGVAQIVGLTFAAAFYIVAFARYLIDLAVEAGIDLGDPRSLLAIAATMILGGVNLVGAKAAGRLQRGLVAILTVLLAILFGYGALDALGLLGRVIESRPFAPRGSGAIIPTAALVFTSYLGFVQVVTSAGEVRDPRRTLPRALLGSVAVAALIYMLALFVTTRLFSADRLSELGEAATTEVARELLGSPGASVVLIASLLATLSSANASVLSASRAVYALARDGLAPTQLRRVHDRLQSPHLALLSVCGVLAALTLLDQLELLAQIASALHLVLYGSICAALLVRRHRGEGSEPSSFRVRFGRPIAVAGLVGSLGMFAAMDWRAIVSSVGVLVAGGLWHAVWGRHHVDFTLTATETDAGGAVDTDTDTEADTD